MGVGASVRQLRLERGFLGKELAAAAGVSPSLISQIENETTTPSLDVLRSIANALHVQVGDFFTPDGTATGNGVTPTAKATRVVRANARKKLILPTSHWVYELLTPDLQGRIELLWIEIGPGLPPPSEPSAHEGEESNVVIRGRVHIRVENEDYVLQAGDSITFESSRPHWTANLDDEPAVLISAITPPSF
jgi:transcriptional regulator with XRE-family HTH domain